ncbi:MAG: TraR/DksA family transcriptional regulator [Bdellovibrionota bacterium]
MAQVSSKVIQLCKEKLLEKKAEILNRVRQNYADYSTRDRGGDETDQALDVLAEDQFLNTQERLRTQLLEIEIALAKIQKGNYGICEETEEPIEPDRLLAIPWTRLSIEGAEMREDLTKRYAK